MFQLLSIFRWIPDSPKWLLQQGRIKEAKFFLEQAATINGNTKYIPSDFSSQLQEISNKMKSEPDPDPWWSIWQEKGARKNLICAHLAWSIFIPVYYGMLLNIRAFGTEHLRINTVIAGQYTPTRWC